MAKDVGSDAKLKVLLEEFRIMRNEIDSSVQESDRWLQFSLTLAGAFTAGTLVAARSEDTAEAAALLLVLGSIYLSFAALLYLRGDIKRARVIKYFDKKLAPAIRQEVGDDHLLGWHDFSRDESDNLRHGRDYSFGWLKWGYLGRTLVFCLLAGGAAVFLIIGGFQIFQRLPEDTSRWNRVVLRIGAALAATWLFSVLAFAWRVRREPNVHGG